MQMDGGEKSGKHKLNITNHLNSPTPLSRQHSAPTKQFKVSFLLSFAFYVELLEKLFMALLSFFVYGNEIMWLVLLRSFFDAAWRREEFHDAMEIYAKQRDTGNMKRRKSNKPSCHKHREMPRLNRLYSKFSNCYKSSCIR